MTDISQNPLQKPVWSAHILTLFPEMFSGHLEKSLSGRALQKNIWSLAVTDIRDFARDKHKIVDAPPAGGGAGMVMRADVAGEAVETTLNAISKKGGGETLRLYPSPRGVKFTQQMAETMAHTQDVMILCGRYEGLDQRVIDHYALTEVSIGDYVLFGGEIAALVMIEAVVRLLPGVLGKATSHEHDSFQNGLLEHDHYTVPRHWKGQDIPEILLSGHHKNIAAWRYENAQMRTKTCRPDLWGEFMQNKG